ncbi:phosphoglycolate phosphatase-like protein, partial [Dinothrombium tinctorium]
RRQSQRVSLVVSAMIDFPKCATEHSVGERIVSEVDYVFVDCDGVLWLDNDIIPGTDRVINSLRRKGKKIIFATNNSSKSREDILSKLNKMGFNATIDEIMITSFALCVYLKKLNFNGKVYVFGGKGLSIELNNAGFENIGVGKDPLIDDNTYVPNVILDNDVKAIVVAYDIHISLPKLIKACTYAKNVDENFFIATNTDETFPTPMKHLVVPGSGAFVSFIRTACGRKPVILGKPGKFFFDCVKAVCPDVDPARSVMIGDRLNTDIAFGNNNGFRYTIHVQTGVDSLDDIKECIKKGEIQSVPSHYIHSLADLNKFL